MARTARTSSGQTWNKAKLAPVVLLSGPETVLADRAVESLLAQAKKADPEVDVIRVDAAAYEPGALEVWASPSLFGEAHIVVVDNVESCTDEFLTEAVDYLDHLSDDLWLVLCHRGGVRGKRLLDAIKSASFPTYTCEAMKKDTDKADFISAEFAAADRTIEPEAVHALIEAIGSNLAELVAACAQLIADTDGMVTTEMVNTYQGGRVEATGFRVADAAVSGKSGTAIGLLRHALDTGLDPVPIVAVLAMKLRTLAKVAALRGRPEMSIKDLGLAPWQVDRARRELTGWTPTGLAQAIQAVARADAEVKGAGRDPIYALERAVLTIAQAHGR